MTTLYYIMASMCSRRYTFASPLKKIEAHLSNNVIIKYIMDGLAPDSNKPMPAEIRCYVQSAWPTISQELDMAMQAERS